ncbi:copper amine oxidase N-terminal domain-containing protein [Paenibacillus sp. UMB4589-SE434]|uniref:copper amine oxidase N-terminal domain-containing protein n=1 Tax=Paenibacillus sp. UMB4589-SE434 TaxID=3046314 RepID=UPI00254E0A44|nr:copper amine oxidase N-terminal domain-containing protein [Paenibacillus sp. UMB4589-SE434]MDK8181483.1 copper amine oxidase N-terminal domain-containing protein [Paenibacillus sp. UMB4589-SE434]
MITSTRTRFAALVLSFSCLFFYSSTIIPAKAASTHANTISVLIDNKQIHLNTAPITSNGSILVPFRPIFEQLGLHVQWDGKSQTVTGTRDKLVIKLQIGSKQARINGTAVALTSAPQSIHNSTYIPIRFIGEATGNTVKWDKHNQQVLISTSSTTPKEQQSEEQQVMSLFTQYIQFANEKNYERLMGLMDTKGSLYQLGSSIQAQMNKFDLATTLKEIHILDLRGNSALVHTVELTHSVKGAFKPDSRSDNLYTVNKVDGAWKISERDVSDLVYIVLDDVLLSRVSLPDNEEKNVMDSLQQVVKYENEENIEGLLGRMKLSTNELLQSKQAYVKRFNTFDLAVSLEQAKVIHYSGNEVAVHMVQTFKKIKGPDFENVETSSVVVLEQGADGQWMIVRTYPLRTTPLATP